MGRRIVIDPVTRIEGHLRVEVEVEKGEVIKAWTKGTMFRGIEQIIQGRDPRDAIYIAERICGVCMASHGWTAAMAVEDASNVELPTAARLIRNLLVGSLWLHDHPLNFYHLSALDYLDVLAIRDYHGKDQNLLTIKEKVMKLVEMGDTAPLTPRYEPDDFSVRDPEVVTSALAHYFQALKVQAKAKKMSAILGGKQPHQSSIVVGGVTIYPTEEQLDEFEALLEEVVDFIKNIYVPDVFYFCTEPLLPLARSGFGAGTGNYLSYGGFPMDDSGREKLFAGGFIKNNDPDKVHEVNLNKITEAVTSSWYREAPPMNPWESKTEVDFEKDGAYSFVKSPRYDGFSTEVGPLARMLVSKQKAFLDTVRKYNIKPGAVARHLARAQESLVVADAMFKWLRDLRHNLSRGIYRKKGVVDIHDSRHWEPPRDGRGVGLNEAPRGALGHWVEIDDHKVKNYQIVVPTTWNVSPRDERGVSGPIEHALTGIPVDPNNPVNLVRVIRSFDPCLACAVHVLGPDCDMVIRV